MLLMVLSIGFTYAQKETKLKLNEETNLFEVTMYHDNGEISQTGFYTKEKKPHGDWFSYNTVGERIVSAKYDKGLKVGTWFFWKGNQMQEVVYSNGRISSVGEWKDVESALAINK